MRSSFWKGSQFRLMLPTFRDKILFQSSRYRQSTKKAGILLGLLNHCSETSVTNYQCTPRNIAKEPSYCQRAPENYLHKFIEKKANSIRRKCFKWQLHYFGMWRCKVWDICIDVSDEPVVSPTPTCKRTALSTVSLLGNLERVTLNKSPTRCNSVQSDLFHCKVTLHVSGVTAKN